MKKNIYLLMVFLLASGYAFSQDEGKVVVKERFERDNTLYFSIGYAKTLGQNLGDYSGGLNVDLGYLKRKNRILSFGPSFSYLYFPYDESKTAKNYYDVDNNETIILGFTGGDISVVSLGFNIKVDFIPVSDNSKFSFYGMATPFIGLATKSEMTGTGTFFGYNSGDGLYDRQLTSATFTSNDVDGFKKQNSFTGGMHLGFGFEVRPIAKFSFFGQAMFSYTLPVNYIATKSFLKDEDRYHDKNNTIYYDASKSLYTDPFPIVKKGFSAVSFKVGVAYNF